MHSAEYNTSEQIKCKWLPAWLCMFYIALQFASLKDFVLSWEEMMSIDRVRFNWST